MPFFFSCLEITCLFCPSPFIFSFCVIPLFTHRLSSMASPALAQRACLSLSRIFLQFVRISTPQDLLIDSDLTSALRVRSMCKVPMQLKYMQFNNAVVLFFLQGYGPQSIEEKQKLYTLLRSLNFNSELASASISEPYTPTGQSFSGGVPVDGFYSPELRGEFGAGLLDLHAMDDSELLSEVFLQIVPAR